MAETVQLRLLWHNALMYCERCQYLLAVNHMVDGKHRCVGGDGSEIVVALSCASGVVNINNVVVRGTLPENRFARSVMTSDFPYLREEAAYDQFIAHNCAGPCPCEDCKKYMEAANGAAKKTILPEGA